MSFFSGFLQRSVNSLYFLLFLKKTLKIYKKNKRIGIKYIFYFLFFQKKKEKKQFLLLELRNGMVTTCIYYKNNIIRKFKKKNKENEKLNMEIK